MFNIQDLADSRVLHYTEGKDIEGFQEDFGTILPFTSIINYGSKHLPYYIFVYNDSLDLELIWKELYKAAIKLEVAWLDSKVNSAQLSLEYHFNANTFEVIE